MADRFHEGKSEPRPTRSQVQCCVLFATVCILLLTSARHIGSGVDDGIPFDGSTTPSIAGNLTIRYALLSPDKDWKYVRRVGLPQLQSSICLVERFLIPKWRDRFGATPQYIIYTDNGTHRAVAGTIKLGGRVNFINLDVHIEQALPAIANLSGLDPKNHASVRRLLADATLLPPTARLLLGTDVSIIREPMELIARATAMTPSQAIYMADRYTFASQLYTLRGDPSPGPQCRGLVADFMLIGPNVTISVQSVTSALNWYKAQPVSLLRTSPPCVFCVAASNGLHAIDQFAMSLVLGAAVSPQGQLGVLLCLKRLGMTPGVTRSNI